MRTLYFLSCFFLSFFFFSSPNLSGRRLDVDVYHTSTHSVALVRIQNAGLKCGARGSLEMQNAKNLQNFAICAPSHEFVGLHLSNKGNIDNQKKNLLNSNISSICSHNMANFGPLTAEIGSAEWDTPANFNGFRVLTSLLQRRRTSLTRGQPNFARCLTISWADTRLFIISRVLQILLVNQQNFLQISQPIALDFATLNVGNIFHHTFNMYALQAYYVKSRAHYRLTM